MVTGFTSEQRHECVSQVDTCLRCLAVHLVSLGDDERLAKLISASAETVAAREAVDTVPLVDDLRFHISQLHPVASGEGRLLLMLLSKLF